MGTTKSNTDTKDIGSKKNASQEEPVKISFQALIRLLSDIYDDDITISSTGSQTPEIKYIEMGCPGDEDEESSSGYCFYDMNEGTMFNASDTFYYVVESMKEHVLEEQTFINSKPVVGQLDELDDDWINRMVEMTQSRDQKDIFPRDEDDNNIVHPGYNFLNRKSDSLPRRYDPDADYPTGF